jgi:hypothetical protein
MFVKYDNDFYLKQIQQFEDTAKLAVISQKIISVERTRPDLIKMKFEKAPGRNFQISQTLTKSENWYEFLHNQYSETALIRITDSVVAAADSFEIGFKIPDKSRPDGTIQYFQSSADAVYHPAKLFVRSAKRTEKNKIYFAFSTEIERTPTLQTVNFKAGATQMMSNLNATRDTFFVSFSEKSIYDKDTLKIKISYFKRNTQKQLEEQSETLILPVDSKSSQNKTKTEKEPTTVTVELPVPFTIEKDSALLRKYYIKSKLTPGRRYILKMDSDAIFDIFENKTLRTSQTFTVRKTDYYGTVLIDLRNTGALNSKNFSDINKKYNSHSTNLQQGQIIVFLTDKNGTIIRTERVNSDKQIRFNLLAPTEYKLFLFYDENNNEKWDTGDYLKHKQAEKTLYYRKSVVVKSKFETQIDWTIQYED